MEKVIIKSDVLNIAKRIKGIDKNYILVFNKLTNKFEVYYKNLKDLQLVLPFNVLDCRSVEYVAKTRVQNKEKLIKEMEEYNLKLENENIKKTKDLVMQKILN